MPLFHFAPQRLGQGSVIQSGNWGRLMKRYLPGSNFGNPWVLARELIFEQVRMDEFPAKPSRFLAIFALPTREDADLYRGQADANYQSVLHEVELVDDAVPAHETSVAFLDMRDGAPFLDPTRIAARSYWLGEEVPNRAKEVITASALRVVRCVD